MKISIALICILAEVVCIYGHFPQEEMKRHSEECKAEIGIEGISAGSSAKSQKEKCYLACMMEKEGMMMNGKLDFEKVVAFSSKLRRNYTKSDEDILKFCVDTGNKENDKCEVAMSMANCADEKVDGRRKMHRDIED